MSNKKMIILSKKSHHNERVKETFFFIKYDSHIEKETKSCFIEEELK